MQTGATGEKQRNGNTEGEMIKGPASGAARRELRGSISVFKDIRVFSTGTFVHSVR